MPPSALHRKDSSSSSSSSSSSLSAGGARVRRASGGGAVAATSTFRSTAAATSTTTSSTSRRASSRAAAVAPPTAAAAADVATTTTTPATTTAAAVATAAAARNSDLASDARNGDVAVTPEQLAAHNTYNDCWLAVHGVVYDVTAFAQRHPGGALLMQGAGRECTALFESTHPLSARKLLFASPSAAAPSSSANATLPRRVGLLTERTASELNYVWEMGDNDFYPTLKRRVEALLRARGWSRRTVEPFLMAKSLFTLFFWALFFYVGFVRGSLWGAALLGFFHVQAAFTMTHDGNHGAFAKSPFLNRLAVHVLDAMGGSSLVWQHQHNIIHHPRCNHVDDEDGDGDVRVAYPVLRMNAHLPLRPWHRLQHIYCWIAYSSSWYNWVIADVPIFFSRKYLDIKWNPLTLGDIATVALGKLLFVCYSVGVPFWLHSFGRAIAINTLFMLVCGFFSSIFFTINHLTASPEFVGTAENSYFDAKTRDWAKLQVATSNDCAVNSWWTGWVSGGLNTQIEHHLFPALPHTLFPSIAPIVAETCREFNVPYTVYPSLLSALRAHFNHVRDMATAAFKPLPAKDQAKAVTAKT